MRISGSQSTFYIREYRRYTERSKSAQNALCPSQSRDKSSVAQVSEYHFGRCGTSTVLLRARLCRYFLKSPAMKGILLCRCESQGSVRSPVYQLGTRGCGG